MWSKFICLLTICEIFAHIYCEVCRLYIHFLTESSKWIMFGVFPMKQFTSLVPFYYNFCWNLFLGFVLFGWVYICCFTHSFHICSFTPEYLIYHVHCSVSNIIFMSHRYYNHTATIYPKLQKIMQFFFCFWEKYVIFHMLL